MKESAKYNLRPLWDALLELYCTYRKICGANGLRHYVAFGTALGAARHKGFIPWDDDFDVYMPREDYERLFRLREDYLPKGVILKDARRTVQWPYYFGKIAVSDESICAKVRAESGLDLGQGIFIDIFPLDGLPTNKWLFYSVVIIRALFRGSANFFSKIGLKKAHLLAYNKWASLHKYSKCHYVQSYNESREKILSRKYTRQMFGDAQEVQFENTTVLAPRKLEDYLEAELEIGKKCRLNLNKSRIISDPVDLLS